MINRQQQQEQTGNLQNRKLMTSDSSSKIILQEPDVIASTKLAHSKTADSITPSSGPVAPPRRKKKSRKISTSSSEQFNMNEGLKLPPMETDNKQLSLSAQSLASQSHSQLQQQQQQLQKQQQEQQKQQQQRAEAARKLRDDLVKELENSWNEVNLRSAIATKATATAAAVAGVSGSIGRVSHSLGNSSTSVYSKPSPSNSAKSNSAPGRVRYL